MRRIGQSFMAKRCASVGARTADCNNPFALRSALLSHDATAWQPGRAAVPKQSHKGTPAVVEVNRWPVQAGR